MSEGEVSQVSCGQLVLCTSGGGGGKCCCNCKPPPPPPPPQNGGPDKMQLMKLQAKNSARQAQISCQQALVAAEQSRIATLLAKTCDPNGEPQSQQLNGGSQSQQPQPKQTLEIHTHPCSDCGSNQNNDSNKIILDVCGKSPCKSQENQPGTIKLCPCSQKEPEKPQKKEGSCCCCRCHSGSSPCSPCGSSGSSGPCQHLTIKPAAGSSSSQCSFVISVKKPKS